MFTVIDLGDLPSWISAVGGLLAIVGALSIAYIEHMRWRRERNDNAQERLEAERLRTLALKLRLSAPIIGLHACLEASQGALDTLYARGLPRIDFDVMLGLPWSKDIVKVIDRTTEFSEESYKPLLRLLNIIQTYEVAITRATEDHSTPKIQYFMLGKGTRPMIEIAITGVIQLCEEAAKALNFDIETELLIEGQ